MSEDFDVISGPPARPPKIKPSAPPTDAVRRSGDPEKAAAPPNPAPATA